MKVLPHSGQVRVAALCPLFELLSVLSLLAELALLARVLVPLLRLRAFVLLPDVALRALAISTKSFPIEVH